MSDFCLICAEALEWTAVGACGHQEICSRCCSRMRFVLRDNSCPQCRADQPAIFVTRAMGDFTARPGDFASFNSRAAKGELHHLPVINAFFDDQKHFQEVQALCGYTHPILTQDEGKAPRPQFKSINEMRKFIEHNYKQSFCDICIASRKVFLSEQILYTKQQLERHNLRGDDEGPLAAESSGFKGHPICKFCKQRFYDGQELYKHMESAHEHCFICRKAQPDKFVYYRHYQELEDHFRHSHHPCHHPACLEKKFVVFKDELDLKRHTAQEHGDELKLTKAQRREAFTLPVNLQFNNRDPRGAGTSSGVTYGSDPEAAAAAAELAAAMARPGVIMGGGAGFNSRNQPQRPTQPSSMHHSRSEPQFHTNSQPEGSDQAEDSVVTFSPEDFPSVTTAYSSRAGSSIRQLATWAASGNRHTPLNLAASSSSNSASAAGQLNTEEFPELPSLSKAQKKKLQQQNQSLAQRLSNSARPAQVVYRAQPSVPPSSVPTADDFPSLPAPPPPFPAATNPFKPGSSLHRQKMSLGSFQGNELPPPSSLTPPPPPDSNIESSSSSAAALFHTLTRNRYVGHQESSSSQTLAPPALDEFPSLPASAPKTKGKKGLPPPPSSSSATTGPDESLQAAFKAAAVRRAPRDSVPNEPEAPEMSPSDFPSLPTPSPLPSKPNAPKGKNSKAKPSPSKTPPPRGGPSEALREANMALITRIKLQLNDEERFSSFRDDSSKFLRGDLDAKAYHSLLVSHGLVNLAADLASLCPDTTRRQELMLAHSSFLTLAASSSSSTTSKSWVPPEAAAAMKAELDIKTKINSSWTCGVCTLVNAPGIGRCEACGSLSPEARQGGLTDDFPALGPSSAAPTSVAQPAGKLNTKKGKGVVLTLGLQRGGTKGFETAPPPPPPSAWGSR